MIGEVWLGQLTVRVLIIIVDTNPVIVSCTSSIKFTSGALTKHSSEECIRICAQKLKFNSWVGKARKCRGESVYSYSMSPVIVKSKRLKE